MFSPDDYQPTPTFYAYLILILGGVNRIWAIPVGAVLFSLLYTGTRFLNFFPLSLFDPGERAFLRLFLVGPPDAIQDASAPVARQGRLARLPRRLARAARRNPQAALGDALWQAVEDVA